MATRPTTMPVIEATPDPAIVKPGGTFPLKVHVYVPNDRTTWKFYIHINTPWGKTYQMVWPVASAGSTGITRTFNILVPSTWSGTGKITVYASVGSNFNYNQNFITVSKQVTVSTTPLPQPLPAPQPTPSGAEQTGQTATATTSKTKTPITVVVNRPEEHRYTLPGSGGIQEVGPMVTPFDESEGVNLPSSIKPGENKIVVKAPETPAPLPAPLPAPHTVIETPTPIETSPGGPRVTGGGVAKTPAKATTPSTTHKKTGISPLVAIGVGLALIALAGR